MKNSEPIIGIDFSRNDGKPVVYIPSECPKRLKACLEYLRKHFQSNPWRETQ